jgi:peptide/nickel transport system substrate-binding protein
MKGQIAEKWTIGGDKLTYTFNLRRNVLFHDGKPLTSADVLFSYNMMMSEKIPNAHKKVYYKDVLSVSAPDAYTVVFRMKNRYAMALEHLGGFEVIPRHVYSVGDFMKDERNLRGPVGSGPYTFNEWKTGQRVVLSRFENYWGEKPEITKIEFTIIKNDAVALQALKKGDVDSYNLRPLQWTRQTNSDKFLREFEKIKYLAQVTAILAITCAAPVQRPASATGNGSPDGSRARQKNHSRKSGRSHYRALLATESAI